VTPTYKRLALTTLAVLALAACSDNATITIGPVPEPDKSCDVLSDNGSVSVGSGLPGDPAAPEPASGYKLGMKAVTAKTYMVVTANPLATKAGCEILKKGGSAVDAAVAVQAVLGLVEPQSSGLGGGAFMLHYEAASGKVKAFDGRETAPAAATANYLRWIDDTTQQTTPLPNTRASGRAIGTPSVMRMLDLAYKSHGSLPWSDLFSPAINLSTQGFAISGRLAQAISGSAAQLVHDKDAAAYFLNADGSAKALGTQLKNPAYADTLDTVAKQGVQAFYAGPIAQSIVDKIQISASAKDGSPITPGKTTLADLAAYQAKVREAVCIDYRSYKVCGMPPPSSGGIAVAQALGILENYDLGAYKPASVDLYGGKPSVMGVHLVSEALRLAYADRDKYVADTDFVPLPGQGVSTMLDKGYLKARANLISTTKSMGVAQAGDLGAVPLGVDKTPENGTTHFTIVDKQGNAVSMTTTVEASLGSFHMTRGFMLNNQLTDFSPTPTDASGTPIANRVAPGKRPRSSMAPTLVFQKRADGSAGPLVMGTGSPGGATIIQYVTKTVVGVLDWGLDAQQATAMIDFGASNSPTTNVGGEHPNVVIADGGANDPLVQGLKALGHTVNLGAQSSGIGTIVRTQQNGTPTWTGGADPRREGLVLGDAFKP
jgi:gamma-glutamyltranspeptidase/glutathione hydrolase